MKIDDNRVAKAKRKLAEVIAEIPSTETINFKPLEPGKRPPKINLPPNIDMNDPYALFTLFFSEDIFHKMSSSTNAYASYHQVKEAGRTWTNTNELEIRAFIGALIYMGIKRSRRIDRFWAKMHWATSGRVSRKLSLRPPAHYMSQKRFEQLKRYVHISGPQASDPNKKEWWYRLEPLASRFRENSMKYYTPGSNISVDEIVVRCFGRSSHTYRMPHKPIKQGYKIFCLAEHGYIWTFSWSSRQLGIEESFQYPGLTPTGSMVMKMMDHLPQRFSGGRRSN